MSQQRVITYVDGFNLYFGLKDKGWKRYYWLNPLLLAENLLKPCQELVALKYFTARITPPPRDPDKSRRQATWLEAVESLPKTTVYYGHYLPKQVKCRRCGASWVSPEEKMTDVNIAVQLMCDADDDAFDVALLISADSDLAPPVEAIRHRFPQKQVIAIAPPERQSKKLESVASAALRLGRKKIQDSQFPDEYAKPNGFTLRRPPTWR